ncbi:MAG TPA: MBL fold metallo-hydrolase [Anaerovoracaceae bacterium]|nr:MBL fold metallo-hydrolase [Anaerovoracaceae bacterium]
MKAIKRRLYLYAGVCALGVVASILFFIDTAWPGQSGRFSLLLILAATVLAAALTVREGRRLSAARLIAENQILHIQAAIFQTQHNSKHSDHYPNKAAEVFISCFGIIVDSKIIKFNQEGIRLKAVEIGGGYLSLRYGTDTATQNVMLLHTGADRVRLEDIIERFRYETGITPVLIERGRGTVMVDRIKCRAVNCYLLTGSKGSILVDAGNPSDVSRIYDRVKDRNVRLILLTHGHPDHIGAASGLARLLHVPIAMSREDAVLLEAPAVRKLQGHTFLGWILTLTSNLSLRGEADLQLSPDIWLEDGQDLMDYGVEARIVSLPGHTKGSVGVLTGEKDFIVGDALFHIIRPTTALIYENREQMEKSAGIIIRSGARFLYAGHGSPFSNEKFTQLGDIPSRPRLL